MNIGNYNKNKRKIKWDYEGLNGTIMDLYLDVLLSFPSLLPSPALPF